MTNRLPAIGFVESGGADLPRQKEIFVPGGANFRNLTRKSAAGIPTVAIVTGNATAGGAYQPGMSDYTVMVREQGLVFLGGPPLVKMATGEDAEEEALGGAEMHARVSGVNEFIAADEVDAARIGREIVRNLNWRKHGPGAARRGVRPPPRSRGPARDRLPRPEDPLRRPRGDRPDRRRLALRRVQARIRHPARHRLGRAARLARRDPRQQRRDLQRGRREGRPLHPARRPGGHAAAVPAEHDRLHRRRAVRAARHRQGRRQDDQRRRQRRRAEADADDGRLLRRRQLRDVRPQLRAALHLQLAEPQDGRDGSEAARRRHGDRHARRSRAARDRGRRGGAGGRARRRSRTRSSASRTPSSPPASSGTTA